MLPYGQRGNRSAHKYLFCIRRQFHRSRPTTIQRLFWRWITTKLQARFERKENEIDVQPVRIVATERLSDEQSFYIFSKATSFEDAIRLAISHGGDSDTIGAIVGSIAEARFGIPQEMKEKAISYLPDDMKEVLIRIKCCH